MQIKEPIGNIGEDPIRLGTYAGTSAVEIYRRSENTAELIYCVDFTSAVIDTEIEYGPVKASIVKVTGSDIEFDSLMPLSL